jgi:hypothetical protein
VDKIVPLIILFIVITNVLKWFGQQSKQGQQRTPQQPKPHPTPGERKGGTLADVIRQIAEQQKAAMAPPTQQPKRVEPQADQRYETEYVQDGRVVWQAQKKQIEEFLGVKREPPAPFAPPPITVEDVTPEVRPRPVPVPREAEKPTPRAAQPKKPARRRVRKMKPPMPVALPGGVFQNLDDVRRGIIMSEILGPPAGLK